MSTQLIPVVTSEIGSQTVQAVDGRTLHAFLEVKSQFRDWISNRIEEYGFESGKDFRDFFSESTGGRPTKEYTLTLNMAKELSMVERNAKGKQARQYFIECERRLLEQSLKSPATPPPIKKAIRTRDDLSFTRRSEKHGGLINWDVPHIPGRLDVEQRAIGKAYFAEVEELARYNVEAAREAVEFALSGAWMPIPNGSSNWDNLGWGIECGFAQAIAEALFRTTGPTSTPPKKHLPSKKDLNALPPLPSVSLSKDPAARILELITQAGATGITLSELHKKSRSPVMPRPRRHQILQDLLAQGVIAAQREPARGGGDRHVTRLVVT